MVFVIAESKVFENAGYRKQVRFLSSAKTVKVYYF